VNYSNILLSPPPRQISIDISDSEYDIRQREDAARQKAQSLQLKPAQIRSIIQKPGISSSHADLMRAAGIPESEWWAVEYIVAGESGWNPCAYYPGKSNCALTPAQINATDGNPRTNVACGLGMQLPCGKWSHQWNDPVGALIDMNSYVNRYGGWAGAAAWWRVHHSY
jgi:hypothetical protein